MSLRNWIPWTRCVWCGDPVRPWGPKGAIQLDNGDWADTVECWQAVICCGPEYYEGESDQ